jgi:2-iminobutanoate/2-iminopropanoate deaminase
MKAISTDQAPAAIGPYSQAVQANGFLFCSGQIALDPETMELIGSTAAEQTEQILKNLDAVFTEAGTSKNNVVKTTIFLSNMEDFTAVNEVYASFFGDHKPARATVEVSRLPKDALVEIEAVSLCSDS